MKYIIILLCLISISGCSTGLQTSKIIDLDRPQCEQIPDFVGETMGDLYESYINLAKLYEQCSNLNQK